MHGNKWRYCEGLLGLAPSRDDGEEVEEVSEVEAVSLETNVVAVLGVFNEVPGAVRWDCEGWWRNGFEKFSELGVTDVVDTAVIEFSGCLEVGVPGIEVNWKAEVDTGNDDEGERVDKCCCVCKIDWDGWEADRKVFWSKSDSCFKEESEVMVGSSLGKKPGPKDEDESFVESVEDAFIDLLNDGDTAPEGSVNWGGAIKSAVVEVPLFELFVAVVGVVGVFGNWWVCWSCICCCCCCCCNCNCWI